MVRLGIVTDPLADNYDSFATYDNSSCTGSIVSSDDFTFAGEFNENYYYKSKYSHTWIESFDLALNNNGYLSTVRSQEENDFINSFCEGFPLWIGFTDQENEGVRWMKRYHTLIGFQINQITPQEFNILG